MYGNPGKALQAECEGKKVSWIDAFAVSMMRMHVLTMRVRANGRLVDVSAGRYRTAVGNPSWRALDKSARVVAEFANAWALAEFLVEMSPWFQAGGLDPLAERAMTVLPASLMQSLRAFDWAISRIGWALQYVDAGYADGRFRLSAKRRDGRLLTLIGHQSGTATLMRESVGHRRGGRVGSGPWQPAVISMQYLGRDEGDPRAMLEKFLHYVQDNPAPKALEGRAPARISREVG